MTPYQRGNRDGLLSFAKACDAEAQAERDEVARWERSRHPHSARASENHSFARSALMRAASLARRMAEALPEDPEPDTVTAERDAARKMLAECFRLSGADPDGDEWTHLWDRAVEEVRELRKQYDDAIVPHDSDPDAIRAAVEVGIAETFAALKQWAPACGQFGRAGASMLAHTDERIGAEAMAGLVDRALARLRSQS